MRSTSRVVTVLLVTVLLAGSLLGGEVASARTIGQVIDDATIVAQSGGSIVLAGSTTDQTGNQDVALARFSSNGALDTTFGTSNTGVVTTGRPLTIASRMTVPVVSWRAG